MFPAMVATFAFVAAFVALGLGVVLAAFGGSRRRGPAGARGPSRGTRRMIGVLCGVVIVALGVAIPALVMADNSENHSASAVGGVELNQSQERGRAVFARNCSTCHSLNGANAVGKVGTNLDELRPPKALTLDAIAKGRARGQGQMPAGLVDGQDAQDVAGFIAKVAGR